MNISIITNVITSYREGFYDRLFERQDICLKIYCQERVRGANLKSIHNKYGEHVHIVKNISLKNEKIGFQLLPYRKIIKESDVIFLDGNPRVLSNLLIGLIAFFLRGTRIVIWSMAHSYGANKFTEDLRLKWTSFYENIFVYTDREVELLRKRGFITQNIIGMNNGLDQKKIDEVIAKWDTDKINNWQLKNGFYNKTILLSSARLVPKNKFDQVIKALPNILNIDSKVMWCVIGDGVEEQKLKDLAKKMGVEKNIHFAGRIYDEEKLAPFFLSAELFVHPASIGLGMMHAFGYGLPVVINANELMHGPEYGAFVNGKTGLNFDEDDPEDLARVIIDLLNSPKDRKTMKEEVLKTARKDYNVDVMVDRFIKMAFNK